MGRGLLELLADPGEGPFLRALLGSPEDLATRRQYGEWLVARGDARGELIGLALDLWAAPDEVTRTVLLTRLETLERDQDEMWLAIAVRQGRIGNCGAAADRPPLVRFSFECPRSWERLGATSDPTVRRCDACARDVHRCDSFADAERHALRGDCISVPGRLVSAAHERYCKLVVGRPDALEMWGRRFLGG